MKDTDTLVNSITILNSLCTSVLTYRTLEIAIWLGIDTSKNPATKRRLRKIRNEMDFYKNPRSGIIVTVLGILLIAYVMQCILSISPILFAVIVVFAVVCNLWQFTMDLKKYRQLLPIPQTSNGRVRPAAQKRKETARKKIIVDIIVFVIIIITTIVSLIEVPNITSPSDSSPSAASSSVISSDAVSLDDTSGTAPREESTQIDDQSENPPAESANTQTVTEVTDMIFKGGKYTGEVIKYGDEQLPHGQGTAYYDDGSVYKGGWGYGKKHGECVYWSNKGWVFHGEFLANEKDTKGTHENWPDGHGAIGTYVGTVIDGKFEGEATFEYETGEKFEGVFSANEQWNGTFYDKDGSILYRVKDGKHVS